MTKENIEREARRLYPKRDIHRLAFKKGVKYANEQTKQALLDCVNAIDWALNNTTVDSQDLQSDFFNILMNARTAADKCLNPELPENQPVINTFYCWERSATGGTSKEPCNQQCDGCRRISPPVIPGETGYEL